MSGVTGGSLRATATRIIHQVVHQGQSLGQLLPPALEGLPAEERGRLQDWCFGSCRWWHRLNAELQQRLHKPLPKRQGLLESLLILGLYQLRHTRIAPHAAIHQSVETARELGSHQLTGLINGILRKSLRDGEPEPGSEAMRHSHPQWLMAKLSANWPEQWQTILEANNRKPPMSLRFNPGHHDQTSALAALADAGLTAHPGQLAAHAIQLDEACPVDRIPGFNQGHFSVQDEAAQLCTELLELAPGQRVLDACAAPGGKTGAILENQPALAEVVALDSDRERLGRITENLERIDANARLVAADAGDPGAWWDGAAFDRILLDAPCSGTGVIRRHPDIKLLRRETDIRDLADTQLRLLEACWHTLATGGRLVYATCSVLQQENTRIIQRFINGHMDAQLVPITLDWGIETGYGRQLITGERDQDGFFYACLEKNPAHWA
ncbi:16S rRNA (cytosine(967)-C(5))-methyltransferase RsmB [Salicola sp. Rm-C-2C1-2]|uniref:16S rRNA (cytosine(967)-C(5))-methyltransferase RsmB n=1 Tax=Salicola sp. Rm-C-2C1-2 TaxID=3141321 RepID=UPI0032E45BCC